MRYVYLGDKFTDPRLVGQPCDPVRRPDGKVIVGTGKGVPRNQLVTFADGSQVVVQGRRLRLTEKTGRGAQPASLPGRSR